MSNDQSKELDTQRFASWYREYSERLRAFLLGLLRDHHAVDEALQGVFAKAVASGGTVRPGSEKAWLFQVAFNEAMELRRRHQRDQNSLAKLPAKTDATPSADVELLRWETVHQVRMAIDELPPEQKQVVLLRMHEEKTFQEIADGLQIPLGTVLTRMRLALQKLQRALQN